MAKKFVTRTRHNVIFIHNFPVLLLALRLLKPKMGNVYSLDLSYCPNCDVWSRSSSLPPPGTKTTAHQWAAASSLKRINDPTQTRHT